MNTITFELDGKSMTATIKENVPFNKLMEAVADGVSICYDENGAFLPELVDFAIEYVCLATLTDLKLGKTVNTAWKYIRAIDGVPSVDADFIADGIRAAIQHRNCMVVASMQTAGLHELVERIDRITAGTEQAVSTVSKLLDMVMADLEKNSKVDLQVIADALQKQPLEEQKIATAILDYQEEKAKRQAKAPRAKKAVEPVKE